MVNTAVDLYAFEKRIFEAEQVGIDVYEVSFKSDLKGLCIDDVIFIDRQLPWTEKNCVVAEEIGHVLFSAGDITNQALLENRRDERTARVYAYKKLVSFGKIIKAFQFGCTNRQEVAEYLDITENFLDESIRYYYQRYGSHVNKGGYIFLLSEKGMHVMRQDECYC